MKKAYINKRFSSASYEIIDQAIIIIDEYTKQGFSLTVRQLYYQFVARGFIENKQSSYNRICSIISNARLTGFIDWNAIVDRTRFVRALSHWESVSEIIREDAECYRVDKWKNQNYRPEVWIEKDALIGVIAGVCEKWDVPYFSCRGYISQSELWRASQRCIRHSNNEQKPVIIHLGDHDPSGIDMTRDIEDRLTLFGAFTHVIRIALNMNQVEKFSPPPNPTKLSDTRATNYIEMYGEESWELDALEPAYIADSIEREILKLLDEEQLEQDKQEEEIGRQQLNDIADQLGEEE